MNFLFELGQHPVTGDLVGCFAMAYFAWTLRTPNPYKPEVWGRVARVIFFLMYRISWIAWIASTAAVPVASAFPFWSGALPFEGRLLLSGSFLSWFVIMRLKQDLPAVLVPMPRLSKSPPVKLPNPPGPSSLDP